MKRLFKSSTDRKWLGVAGGLGEYFGMDPTFIRIIFLVLTFVGVSAGFWIYILLGIFLPYDYEVDGNRKQQGQRPFSSGWDRHSGGTYKGQNQRKDVTPEENGDDDDWSNF